MSCSRFYGNLIVAICAVNVSIGRILWMFVIPTIRGGMTIPENLRSVHVECNAIKGEKLLDPSEFGLR